MKAPNCGVTLRLFFLKMFSVFDEYLLSCEERSSFLDSEIAHVYFVSNQRKKTSPFFSALFETSTALNSADEGVFLSLTK